jgi:hypothetical protein
MKITTVGQLREALSNFKDEDTINTNISDDFETYGIGVEIETYTGPGMKDDDIGFFNNGGARIDMSLTAMSDECHSVPMKAKVTKRVIN